MNGDGLFTRADVWLLEKWLLCLPGNFLLELVAFWLPRTAAFFSVQASRIGSSDSFYGVAAWVISFATWAGIWLAISAFLRYRLERPR